MYKFNSIQTSFGEEWKEVDFENDVVPNKYLVSNYGRIAKYKTNPAEAELVKQSQVGGYLTFNIRCNGKRKTLYAHRLVAQYFVRKGNSDQNVVLHKDHDKTNNMINNLCWANIREKTDHQESNPAVQMARLEKRTNNQVGHKLTSTEVIRIKKKIWDPNRKTRMKMIAKSFGISEMQLYRIRSGENWSHIRVEGEPEWTKRNF